MGQQVDFYEDDEPLDKVEAAFSRGVKRLTKRPASWGPAVAFSLNQRLTLDGTTVTSTTIAAVVTRSGR